jgi:hypothetical protein
MTRPSYPTSPVWHVLFPYVFLFRE